MIGGPTTTAGPADTTAGATPVPMTDLEIAWGWVTGTVKSTRPAAPSAPVPLQAFEDAVRPALLRPPCLVEFSGGRDSSAVLAVALSLAQREGHTPPIAVTQRFPGVAEADENRWQEDVISALGATDWVRVDVFDQLDLIGPVAAPSLRRHGMVWPPFAHVRGAIWELARGGSVVTGEGGDEILGPRRLTPVRQVLARESDVTRSTLRAAALAVAPRWLRTRALAGTLARTVGGTWLRPPARDALLREVVEAAAGEPLDRRRALEHHLRSRGLQVALHNMAVMASCFDVVIHHPMLDPGFVGSFAATARFLGPRDRTAAMRSLFGELLPPGLLARSTKARFNRAHFGPHSRAFTEKFNGEGVDRELVDVEALLEAWRAPLPHAMTAALLQAAWLATAAERS